MALVIAGFADGNRLEAGRTTAPRNVPNPTFDMPVLLINKLPAKPTAGRSSEMLVALLGLVLWSVAAQGQTSPIQASLPGYVETGTPPFVVLGPEALGLSAAPVDLQQMPDGRLLAFGRGELALGDGVRWEVFRQAVDDPRVNTESVAVDQTGRIYAGMTGGFGRIEFNRNGTWRYALIQKSPEDLEGRSTALTQVSMVGGNWFWSWGSGPVIAWQPRSVAKIAGRINALERVFTLGTTVHMSDTATGALLRLENGQFNPIPYAFADQAITCSAPLSDGSTLLGTINLGLLRYDGTTFQPFVSQGPLATHHRINDLCDVGHGLVAVVVDNVGIAFIDQRGRLIQTLDRTVDNRLSRVKRLLRAPGGILWALLNDGIVRIGFPARVSSFESMVPAGLMFSQPFRHDGRLWLASDGQAQRGIYDEEHRLVRFEIDTPGPVVTYLLDLGGIWVAATRHGIFRHDPGQGWTKLAEGPVSILLRPEPVQHDCWLFIAENETGWLRHTGDKYIFERFPQPGFGHPHGALADTHGVFWAELGVGKVARIEPTLPRPTVEILGLAEGVPDGWAQLFLFEGETRMNVNDQILHYDPSAHRFVPDNELLRRIPLLGGALGRPTGDAQGRLWITRPENVSVIDPRSPRASESTETMPEGLRPFYFTPQNDGVVWMNERMRLARFDPTLPAPEPAPLRAIITRVELPASGLVLYPVNDRIPDVPTTDNTLLVHYLAPNQSYGQSVSFEVQLQGTNEGWVSTGSTGSITFNHLNPGAYQLHVRPRLGSQTGEEARLIFSVLAPWYRTRLAYLLYGIGTLGGIACAIWLTTYFPRREKKRLEQLVAIRTRELHATNHELECQIWDSSEKALALRTSEERFRRLSDNAPDIIFRVRIVPDVGYEYISPAVTRITGFRPEEFLNDPAFPRKITQPAGAETIYDNALARQVPAGVRNVRWMTHDGRIVTLEERLSPVYDGTGNLMAIEGISRDITQRVAEQELRQKLESQLLQSQKLESVGTLAGGIAHDFNNILTGILGYCELASLSLKADRQSSDYLREIRSAGLRAKDLVNQILTFSRRAESRLAAVNLAEVVREAVKLVRASTPAMIEIHTELHDGVIQADSTQIHQVVVNLCTNGIHAMQGRPGALQIGVHRIHAETDLAREISIVPAGSCLRLSVSDTGHGIDPATLARIFDPFFTTKSPGEGTGLGLSIVQGIVANHGAALRVRSHIGQGTTFEIFFSESSASPEHSKPAVPPPEGGQKSILVVDDEPSVASFIAATLKRFDYQVAVFHDPREAVAAFAAAPTQFAAIVTDLTMPHLTGVELVQQVRATGVIVPVVLTSGYNKELAALSPEVAFRTFLISKPFDSVDLARILGQALSPIPPPQGPLH